MNDYKRANNLTKVHSIQTQARIHSISSSKLHRFTLVPPYCSLTSSHIRTQPTHTTAQPKRRTNTGAFFFVIHSHLIHRQNALRVLKKQKERAVFRILRVCSILTFVLPALVVCCNFFGRNLHRRPQNRFLQPLARSETTDSPKTIRHYRKHLVAGSRSRQRTFVQTRENSRRQQIEPGPPQSFRRHHHKNTHPR